jgi:hypothetical protein
VTILYRLSLERALSCGHLGPMHFDAELAEKGASLGGGDEFDGLGFCGVENLERHLGRSPRDSAAVYHQDKADGRDACGWDIIERSVGVAEDGAWVGIVEGAAFEGDFLARLKREHVLLCIL